MRFRRPPMARRGPGLVGTMARTAVVAGTATVTAKAVGGAMDSHAQAQQQQQADAMQAQADMQQMQAQMQQQQAQMQQMQQMQNQLAQQQPVAPPVQAPTPPAAPDSASVTAQLQQLAQFKESGVLTDEEFQAAKAKILGS